MTYVKVINTMATVYAATPAIKERVEHEEPYRASMKWFAVYGTSSNKQLFCIRPGIRETDGMAVEELTEFFNAVMWPGKAKSGDNTA